MIITVGYEMINVEATLEHDKDAKSLKIVGDYLYKENTELKSKIEALSSELSDLQRGQQMNKTQFRIIAGRVANPKRIAACYDVIFNGDSLRYAEKQNGLPAKTLANDVRKITAMFEFCGFFFSTL